MIEKLLIVSLVLFSIAIVVTLYRIIFGPSVPDRVLAMDMIAINIISGIAVISIILKTKAFIEVILILGILGFISTIALSKFVERGVIIEHKRNR